MTRKTSQRLTPADLMWLRASLRQHPDATARQLAAMHGCDHRALLRLARRNGIKLRNGPQRALSAKGPARLIFEELDRLKFSNAQVAKQLQVWPSRVSQWRKGDREPPFFFMQCLADLAGFNFVLVPKKPVSGVSDFASNIHADRIQ